MSRRLGSGGKSNLRRSSWDAFQGGRVIGEGARWCSHNTRWAELLSWSKFRRSQKVQLCMRCFWKIDLLTQPTCSTGLYYLPINLVKITATWYKTSELANAFTSFPICFANKFCFRTSASTLPWLKQVFLWYDISPCQCYVAHLDWHNCYDDYNKGCRKAEKIKCWKQCVMLDEHALPFWCTGTVP